MSPPDPWRPAQYERFKKERSQPFYDLMSWVQPVSGGQVVDLGCGTGELTAELHLHTRAAQTLGIDQSKAMLDKAQAHPAPGLRFEQAEIGGFSGGKFDLVFSNAAIHWVPDHPALLPRLAGWLAPGGQLAVQVPSNEDHPSHQLSRQLAAQSPWKGLLQGWVRDSPVLPPERYAEMLHQLGFAEQQVRLQVYGHTLDSVDGVVEWVKGTLLTDYERRLKPSDYAAFVEAYRALLRKELGEHAPYFYTYKRVLFWARQT